ncbi:hypothetical protein L6452_41397 [Arctium lappa]|uniref:Uncharacterized protein n=1 Tax=Arctium lappa TaxID=4217 RepID=A0ACB8XPM1_ARCLA|nr:hypothetical protein L6452_41397 [Arctium lappa]
MEGLDQLRNCHCLHRFKPIPINTGGLPSVHSQPPWKTGSYSENRMLVISGERKNQEERKVSNNTETAIAAAAFILFRPTQEGVDQQRKIGDEAL